MIAEYIAVTRRCEEKCARRRNRHSQEKEAQTITSLASDNPQNCIKEFPSKRRQSTSTLPKNAIPTNVRKSILLAFMKSWPPDLLFKTQTKILPLPAGP